MVFDDHAHPYFSQLATIRSVAEKLGCTVEGKRSTKTVSAAQSVPDSM
jgi:hypothetical protein